jgi:hypothetical protein
LAVTSAATSIGIVAVYRAPCRQPDRRDWRGRPEGVLESRVAGNRHEKKT